MHTSILILMVIFQVAAGGNIVWETPPFEVPTEAAADVAPVATPEAPALPAWAIEDPYAWERSQCHPVLRGAEPMDVCQVRVRTRLKAVLGDRLPSQLQPEGIRSCRQVSNGSGGYNLTCAPEVRRLNTPTPPAPEVCEERPRALPGGGVVFERLCQPATGQTNEDGLKIRLFGND